MAFGIAFGVVLGIVFGVSFGIALSVAFGMTLSVAFGVTLDVALGIAFGVALRVAGDVALGVAGDVKLNKEFGVAFSVALGMVLGIAFGMMLGIAFILAYTRLPFYFLEWIWSQLLRTHTPEAAARSLIRSPVLYHELSYFPLWGLNQHIVKAAQHDVALARHVLQIAARIPGQQKLATLAQAELIAQELDDLVKTRNWKDLGQLQGYWITGIEQHYDLLWNCSEIANHFQAAEQASSAYLCAQQLQQAQRALQNLSNRLLNQDQPLARFLPRKVKKWQDYLSQQQAKLNEITLSEIPNPFVLGMPLQSDEEWNFKVFRGRGQIVNEVARLLADQYNHSAIALIGPRRCGKTSLLNMLPHLMPETWVVFFDLQDHPSDSPARFYQSLAKAAQEQVARRYPKNLPALPKIGGATGLSAIEAFKDWLSQLEAFEPAKRILLCIDEFERLETLFPDKERELPQFMGLVRATIQHRRRVRLLVAGAAPFADLGAIWNDHFINLRELKITYLDQATCVGLLCKPIPEFPDGAISESVALAVHQRCQGQPFLTQAFGYALVRLLNDEKREQATEADVVTVEPDLLESYGYYFRGIWQEIPAAGQAALQRLLQNQAPEWSRSTEQWLRRRQIINEAGELAIPLFGRWVSELEED